jgi:hypothetical protein
VCVAPGSARVSRARRRALTGEGFPKVRHGGPSRPAWSKRDDQKPRAAREALLVSVPQNRERQTDSRRMRRNPARSGTRCQLPQSCRCRAKSDRSATTCHPKTARPEFSEGKRYVNESSDGQKNDDAQPTQEPAVIASISALLFPLVPAKPDNPDRGILHQNPLSCESASPVNFRALKHTHRRYSVCTDCLHVNTLRNQ